MEKKFKKIKFIEKEAIEDETIEKIDKLEMNINIDSQISSNTNKDNNSYGIPSENNSEEILKSKEKKELITHRILFKKENEKEQKISNNKHLKRKRIPKFDKTNKKKRVYQKVNKNYKKVDEYLGIVNGRLNICFPENKPTSNTTENLTDNNININLENKLKESNYGEVKLLEMLDEKKKIENLSKNMNKDFINRIKENEKFIKNNIIDLNNEFNNGKIETNNKINNHKRNNSLLKPKLKLYKMQGDFLKNNK